MTSPVGCCTTTGEKPGELTGWFCLAPLDAVGVFFSNSLCRTLVVYQVVEGPPEQVERRGSGYEIMKPSVAETQNSNKTS